MFPSGRALIGTPSLRQPSYIKLVFGTSERDMFVYSVAQSCLAGSKFLSDMAENTEDEEDQMAYDNNIGVEGAVALSKIQTLTHLKIRSGNKIGAEGAIALSALQNLQHLMIEHGNHIGTKGLVALTKLKTLQVLKIDCDKDIELEGVESLSNLTNLEQLHIHTSNETKSRLQKLFPNTEISTILL